MASSKDKLTEEQLKEGIMSAVLGAILKGRTKTVLKAFGNDPELKRNAKELAQAASKMRKSLDKANKIKDKKLKAAGLPTTTAFDNIKF